VTTTFCKHCGAKLIAESKFCSNCGKATPSHTTIKETDYADLSPQAATQKSKNRAFRAMVSRRTAFAITVWMLFMIAILEVADLLGLGRSPFTQAIAGITLLSLVITIIVWLVWIVGEYRKEDTKPTTPQEIALHQEALENREKIIKAAEIILAIIFGIVLLAVYLTYFVHIELFFTLTPTTTP
jgi:uncharacterized membrane protein (DUF485 family)